MHGRSRADVCYMALVLPAFVPRSHSLRPHSSSNRVLIRASSVCSISAARRLWPCVASHKIHFAIASSAEVRLKMQKSLSVMRGNSSIRRPSSWSSNCLISSSMAAMSKVMLFSFRLVKILVRRDVRHALVRREGWVG